MIWGSRVEFAPLMISRELQLHGWLCSSMPVCSASSLLDMRVICVAPFGHFLLRVFVFCHCVFRELQMKWFRRRSSEYRKDIDDVLHLGGSLFHA